MPNITGWITPQLFWTIALTIYAGIIVILTKKTYNWMTSKGTKHNIAIYYNRKIIHIFAGGLIALSIPYIFSTPLYPFLCGIVLTIATYIPHKTGKILYWFQTKDNINDVTFCLMWSITILLLWTLLKTPWIAIIPPAFMAFGDGITGIVRNALFKKRTKSPIGNLFMALICIPLGFYLARMAGIPLWGIIAAAIATVVERYEFGIIDDNVLITVSSTIVLYIGSMAGPLI